jgi:hypothetical protein
MNEPFSITASERDNLKMNFPERYIQMLELVIAGKVIVVADPPGLGVPEKKVFRRSIIESLDIKRHAVMLIAAEDGEIFIIEDSLDYKGIDDVFGRNVVKRTIPPAYPKIKVGGC